MNLLKYINGVLFIDDNREDVEQLYKYFEKFNVPCMYINPIDYNGEVSNSIGFARFVFLDLEYLPGNLNLTDVVSLLRDLAEKGMKNVVLIMWTLHDDYIEELKELLDKKMKKDKPILIFNANKNEFIGLSQDEYNTKLNELFHGSIEANPLIFKLLEWEKSANVATYKTFNDIIEISYNEIDKNFDLPLTLSNMASQNIPNDKFSSALNVTNDMLIDKIKYETEKIEDLQLDVIEKKELLRKINFNLMFFNSNLEKTFPGNIYKMDKTSLRIENIINNISIAKEKWYPIIVDMTPACSFAHSDNLILLNGVIFENITEDERKVLIRKDSINNFRKDDFLKDSYIKENQGLCCIILDCFGINIISKNDMPNEPIMCLKESYRTNLQQKFGNYLGRIGDNIYHN